MSLSPVGNLIWTAVFAVAALLLLRVSREPPALLHLGALLAVGLGAADVVRGPQDALVAGSEGLAEAWTHGVLVAAGFRALLDRRWVLPALAGVLLGEELDWGQYFLGFATPEAVRALSDRTTRLNFHNIDGLDAAWRVAPMAAVVASAWSPALRRWGTTRERLGLPVLHPGAAWALGGTLAAWAAVRLGVGEKEANETLEASLVTLYLWGWRLGPDWRRGWSARTAEHTARP